MQFARLTFVLVIVKDISQFEHCMFMNLGAFRFVAAMTSSKKGATFDFDSVMGRLY
jgi:hypothetical protein